MHRIDTSTAQKDKFGAGKNGFTSGNPQTGVPASEVSAEFLDAMQEEICNFIELSGLTLDKPKNNQLYQAIDTLLDAVFPIGIPIPWVAATPPNSRFLIAQGQAFNKTAYPKLGALWPTGVIPFDMRGEFPRGWDNGRGVDTGRALLSAQVSTEIGAFLGIGGGVGTLGIFNYDGAITTEPTWGRVATTTSGTAGQDKAKIRPRNIAFNYIVRAA